MSLQTAFVGLSGLFAVAGASFILAPSKAISLFYDIKGKPDAMSIGLLQNLGAAMVGFGALSYRLTTVGTRDDIKFVGLVAIGVTAISVVTDSLVQKDAKLNWVNFALGGTILAAIGGALYVL